MGATDLTLARLRELMTYNPETGVFTWNGDCLPLHSAGDVVGHRSDGYVLIDIDYRTYRAHRLAWFYVHGRWPNGQLDHKNGDRADNRIDNLREATLTVNNQNLRKARATSKSGFLGVSPVLSKWQARITVGGKQRHLGVFDTPELAHAAYLNAKRELHEGNTL